jgi:Arc/MetJ-type ribon-helix-helix transcriptional regulator
MNKIQIGIRFPEDVKRFIDEQAELNGCSRNSEVIRAIRERMNRLERDGRITQDTEAA